MKNRKQKIRLGIFLITSLSLLILIIVYITARDFFEEESVYYVSYEGMSVSGLENGSPVKYMGINVGNINAITIDPENVNNVIVELALKPDVPVKEDVKADITSIGITGLKAIEIRGGSNQAKNLDPGSFIQSGSSMTEMITGKAEVISEKAEQLLNNLLVFSQPENLQKFPELIEKLSQLTEQTNHTMIKIDSVIIENREDIRQTITPMKDITQTLDQTSRLLLATTEQINLRVKSDTVSEIFSNVRDVSLKLKEADIKSLIENIAIIASQTQQLLIKVDSDINQSSQDLSESLQLLKTTLQNLNKASLKINNDPSILLRGINTREIPDYNLKN